MGTKNCNRLNCLGVASCFIPQVGYLCEKCVKDFKNNRMFKNVAPENLNDALIEEFVDVFLGMESQETENDKILESFFNRHKIINKVAILTPCQDEFKKYVFLHGTGRSEYVWVHCLEDLNGHVFNEVKECKSVWQLSQLIILSTYQRLKK